MTPLPHQVAAAPQRGAPHIEPGTTVLLQCLVVAADRQRREQLAWAAGQSGWRPIQCVDATTAEACSRRTVVQLAVVDLEDRRQVAADDLKRLLERLTHTGGLLLVVCGNEGQVQEEIWARQIGVWMYLPGVGDASELASLLAEARHIAQRLAPAAPMAAWEQPSGPPSAEVPFDRRSVSSSSTRSRRGRRHGA